MEGLKEIQALMGSLKTTMETQNKPEAIIKVTDEIAFKRSDFKRAKQVKNGSSTDVEIYFNDGNKEIASNMKLQDILSKIK